MIHQHSKNLERNHLPKISHDSALGCSTHVHHWVHGRWDDRVFCAVHEEGLRRCLCRIWKSIRPIFLQHDNVRAHTIRITIETNEFEIRARSIPSIVYTYQIWRSAIFISSRIYGGTLRRCTEKQWSKFHFLLSMILQPFIFGNYLTCANISCTSLINCLSNKLDYCLFTIAKVIKDVL